jgi:isopenicillin N synthase-like dioxygenase
MTDQARASEEISAVPIIDIAPYFGGSPAAKREVARAIDAAWREVGFLVISGHGVSEELVERTHRVSRTFYDLPDTAKQGYACPDPSIYRGYFALGGLAAAYAEDDRSAAPDYREMFVMSREAIDPSDPYYAGDIGRRIFQPNIWPQEVAGFREAWLEYYRAMDGLARTLMRLFALALDLPETWFDDKIDKHMTTMTVTNYPDQPHEPAPGQLRCGAHTDYGAMTILKSEDKPGGLEVVTKDGRWMSVPMVPGTFVINLGDLMARWSNDRWVSNLHRVANPPRDKAIGSRRQSLIYFFHPNYDATIECPPSCREDGVAKYAPITAREHLLSKIAKLQDVAPAT